MSPARVRKLSSAAPITAALVCAAAALATPQASLALAAAVTAAAVALARKRGALAVPLLASCAAAWLHALAPLVGWPRNTHPAAWSPAILGMLCALAGQSFALARRPRRGRPVLTVIHPRRYRIYRCHPRSDRAIAWVDIEVDTYGRIRSSDNSHHGIEQAFRERPPDPRKVLVATASTMSAAGKSPIVVPSVETRLVSTAGAALLTATVLHTVGIPFVHTLAWALIAALSTDQAAAMFLPQKPRPGQATGPETAIGEAIAACDPLARSRAWGLSGQASAPRTTRGARRAPATR